jgi:hypothetical protein
MTRSALAPLLSVLALAAAGSAAPARAQATGDGFLFGRPRATLTVRGGYDRPFAQGALFDDAVSQLTLGRSAFAGGSVGGELAIAVSPRIDLAFSGGFASSTRGSEFRSSSTRTTTRRSRRPPRSAASPWARASRRTSRRAGATSGSSPGSPRAWRPSWGPAAAPCTTGTRRTAAS